MEWLLEPAVWIGGVLVPIAGAWLKGFLNQFLPPPARARLAIANFRRAGSPRPADRFRLVACWLENDEGGRGASVVEDAFADMGGVELVRSARLVEAGGAADDWRPAMRAGANKVLKAWNADLTIVGRVDKANEAITLWFVPREGDGTLGRGNGLQSQYLLNNALLGDDFREDLRAQIVAMALSAAAPLADTEARGGVLDAGLRDMAEKMEALIAGQAIEDTEQRARLYDTLGKTFFALGERASGVETLQRAIAAYEAALRVFTRKDAPLDWAMTQNNLGAALTTLGERESGVENLERAGAAFEAALLERTRERDPFQWAATQNNLGAALTTLGEREGSVEKLARAVAAFEVALLELPRARVPLQWAMTQNNLGRALARLGERERDAGRVETAISRYEAALDVFGGADAPFYRDETRKNLDIARRLLRELRDENAGGSG